jgi:hypothetical protein
MEEYEEIGLDYETWSDVELGGKEGKGLPNYVASPNFAVLCASVVYQSGTITYDFVFNVWRDRETGEAFSVAEPWGVKEQMLYDLTRADDTIIAVNASFERAVTKWLYADAIDPYRFQDAAVDAAMVGVHRKLEVASRQLSVTEKQEVGEELIQIFCVPNEFYDAPPTPETIEANGHMDLWLQFIDYCEDDARAGLEIRATVRELLARFDADILDREVENERGTWDMNQAGWHVDRRLLEKMKLRKWANDIIAQRAFQVEDKDGEPVIVNFGSHVQIKKFCEVRGVTLKSTDKYHLPVALKNVKKRIATLQDKDNTEQIRKAIGMLQEVEALIETKMEIGGSALTKLPTILRLVSDDDILRDQYIHIGAPATYRSSGRGAQLQNLKKLDGEIRDPETLWDMDINWSNGDMAGQFRQVLTSRHPNGAILVGDFAGVESRGMAYSAGELWKLDAFRQGQDIYCVLVTKFIDGLTYEEVSDKEGKLYHELRPRGKYSELSCQYQASGKAVQDFMFRLGFEITLEAASGNVSDWRRACPNVVQYWETLDDLLKDSVRANMQLTAPIGSDMKVRITPFAMESVQAQHPGALSLCVQMLLPDGKPVVTRFIHGCYFEAGRLNYYKPAERLNEGKLWRKIDATRSQKVNKELGITNPLEMVEIPYSIYGGKLSGILTQSLCRELFFNALRRLRQLFIEHDVTNAVICGQFHDEINVDWWPGHHSKEFIEQLMRDAMSGVTVLKDFPLDVEVKSSYRYIK